MHPIQHQLTQEVWPIFRRHELNMARRIKDGKASRGEAARMHLRIHVQGARYWHACILRARNHLPSATAPPGLS